MAPEFDSVVRLLAAAAAGALIGFNRELSGKPIGMRTLALVSLGGAIASLAALRFADLATEPDSLSRVVQGILQGVLAGIGFIGAGVILRDAQSRRVSGLTTAATVWVAAALGIACALASWVIVIAGTIIAVAILFVLRVVEQRLLSKSDSEDD